MPQIWMTYQELGELAGAAPEEARDYVIARAWDRRRSHDGLTRVKLPNEIALAYLQSFGASNGGDLGARMAATLRSVMPAPRGLPRQAA